MRKLGLTISNYRKKNQLTIREFSKQSGISTSLISQLERGIGNPSLQVLEIIAKTLGVPLFTLFIDDIDYSSLISKKENREKIYRQDNEHIVYDLLTPDFMKTNVEVLQMEIKPQSKTTESHYQHDNKEEIAVVVKGKINVQLEDEIFLLEEGDVVRIPKNMRHRFINESKSSAEVLFILTLSFY
ncbi:helix-turn-helix domain-containing protein [Macrococcus sp. DPC7161]|uniref:helix-turn-helix domain-containing protein n=1 Tax=Macrococcus sp. DPC7161 TaxID=2507060 RepID=UPI00100BDAFC|nr:XRE family transcriptional regulator [Macrococcus sp. DPC7161]RXK18932.1 XRE family transcriptional regulator [Macrococcus sp. DPC7161]